ncbi:MAG: AlpA family phage regulatory protein [Phycisphaerae bacterium]|nr:AlpA family phage regulatory protein [Phycisphaerae bacterium]
MQEPIDHETMAICSVTAVAAQVGLSRARFYELMKEGVFPQPVYSLRTKRPFYPLDLQKKCVEIRKTGVGLAAQPVVFNAPRKRGEHGDQPQIDYDELTRTLRGMGLRVTSQHVRKAVTELYPKGSTMGVGEESMIRDLYLHFVRER